MSEYTAHKLGSKLRLLDSEYWGRMVDTVKGVVQRLGVQCDHPQIKKHQKPGVASRNIPPLPDEFSWWEEHHPGGQNLPAIIINDNHMRDVTNGAIAAMDKANNPPKLFVRSGKLVRIKIDEQNRANINLVNEDILRSRLARVANFYTFNEKKDELKIADPPVKVVKDILALGEWSFPSLVGIVECPTLRPDGTIIKVEGYDPPTGLFLYSSPDLEVGDIPNHPSHDEVQEAVALLREAMGELPFADCASQANAIALMLTPIVRPAINGNIPLALIGAPQSGTGKTLLCKVVSIIATGHEPDLISAPLDDKEWRKTITSILIQGARIITFDNLTEKLTSGALASALTTLHWEDRLLGKNEIVTAPQLATWIANGNNLQLGGDLPRRCYKICLDAEMSQPWDRDNFTHPDLLGWVKENRGRLIVSCLILARAWVTSGKSGFSGPNIGGFSSWSSIIGGILENAGIQGFLGNANEVYKDASEEKNQWEAFLNTLCDWFGSKSVSTSEIYEAMGRIQDLVETLPDIFSNHLDEKGKVRQDIKAPLGRELKKRDKTRFGDTQVRVVRLRQDSTRNVARWRFERRDSGDTGDDSTPSEESMNNSILNSISPSQEGEGKLSPDTPVTPV